MNKKIRSTLTTIGGSILVLLGLYLSAAYKQHKKDEIREKFFSGYYDNYSLATQDIDRKKPYTPPSTWKTYNISKCISIAVPPTVEQRNSDNNYTQTLHKQYDIDLPSPSENTVVFQQKDLDNIDSTALSTYCRILISVQEGEPGEFPQKDEHEELSLDDIRYFQQIAETNAGTCKIIGEAEVRWVNIAGTYGIEVEYTRTSKVEQGTSVHMYYFFNGDKMANITLAYRNKDKNLWEEDFKQIIKTFKWI